MTKKVKRTRDFDLTLDIHGDAFMPTPRALQRNWLLNRAVKEFADDLVHLDQLTRSFVAGGEPYDMADRTQRDLADDEIMEDWQTPVMEAMANIACENHGDVLEIGFGRGVASEMIQQRDVRSHTIVECNPSVITRFDSWKQKFPDRNIRVIEGRWQDVTDQWAQYDGIFFHTYPLNEQEFLDHVVQSETFAAHFFATASEHLRPQGTFTYLTNEIDSLSRGHQRTLFRHFSSFALSLVENLDVPEDTRDAMWGRSMVIVKAVK